MDNLTTITLEVERDIQPGDVIRTVYGEDHKVIAASWYDEPGLWLGTRNKGVLVTVEHPTTDSATGVIYMDTTTYRIPKKYRVTFSKRAR